VLSRNTILTTKKRSSGLRTVLLAAAVALVATACSSSAPFALNASGPFAFPAVGNPSLERVAIIVTVTNHSGDDLQINSTDFVARDADHRVYAASPTVTNAGTGLETAPVQIRGNLPLPTMTLRSEDVLSGFVVFDVPVGVRPVELVWRQSDTDVVAKLAAAH
jgi:uncharacterized protein DUF4352